MISIKLFGGEVWLVIAGRYEGNFNHFNPQRKKVNQRCLGMLDHMQAQLCVVPRLNFTDKIFQFNVDDCYSKRCRWREEEEGRIIRLVNRSDAVMTNDDETALMISTSDCFSGVLYHRQTRALCLMHLGLANMYSEDDSDSVLEAAIKNMEGFPTFARREELKFWYGGGARECCYGRDDLDLVKKLGERFGFDYNKTAQKGPRRGQSAIPLGMIIQYEAQRLDLRIRQQPEFFSLCTSCCGLVGPPESNELGDFWSHIRLQALGINIRPSGNGVFAKLV